MGVLTMSVLLFAGFAVVCFCAPAIKELPSNKVIVDDDDYLSKEERERMVAGLILQIARDFDEGFITQDELEGRSSFRPDDAATGIARKGKDAIQVEQKANKDEAFSQKT